MLFQSIIINYQTSLLLRIRIQLCFADITPKMGVYQHQVRM
jgi:hypothetical protein